MSVVVLAVAVAAFGCASAPKPKVSEPTSATAQPASAPARQATVAPRAPEPLATGLVFSVEPADAEISVDGRAFGAVGALSEARGFLPLPPGIYQVSLKAQGFVTWRAEVAVRSGTEPIRVKLTPKP
ncbi:MAG TPA: PEGA domain-containing protein [Anaeromyxobacteraceae bacterium]|nr:PEGA domain-containing protein [Anaeromyxobacteraceae bacterium]